VHYRDARAISLPQFPPSPQKQKLKNRSSSTPGRLTVRPSAADFDFLSPGYVRPHHCDVRGITDTSDLSVGFVGFYRPNGGESQTTKMFAALASS